MEGKRSHTTLFSVSVQNWSPLSTPDSSGSAMEQQVTPEPIFLEALHACFQDT